MKKALNVFIKNLRYLFLIGVIAFGLIMIVGCNGGEGAVNGADTIIITGTVYTAIGQQASLSKKDGWFAFISDLFIRTANAFLSTSLPAAHVNVCTIQNNQVEPLPAHPTVLADSRGTFVISVNKNDVPLNREMFVCVAEPTSSSYTIIKQIEKKDLPDDLTDVTTISVDPDVNDTIITRFACSQPVLFYTEGKCIEIPNQIPTPRDALDNFFDRYPDMVPDLRDMVALINFIAKDVDVRPVLDAWRQAGASGVGYWEFISGAQNFTNPNIPAPEDEEAEGDDGGDGGDGDGGGGGTGVAGTLCMSSSDCIGNCFSTRACVDSLTCSCEGTSSPGPCFDTTVECSTSGVCGDGIHACCVGYSCVNGSCKNSGSCL